MTPALSRLRRAAVVVVFTVGVVGSVASEPSEGSFGVAQSELAADPVTLRFGLDARRPSVRFAVVVDASDVDRDGFASVSADVSADADNDVGASTFEVGFDQQHDSDVLSLATQGLGVSATYVHDGDGDLVVRRSDPEGAGVVTVDVVVRGSVFVDAEASGTPVLSVSPAPE